MRARVRRREHAGVQAGATPLHLAAQLDRGGALVALLWAGADARGRDTVRVGSRAGARAGACAVVLAVRAAAVVLQSVGRATAGPAHVCASSRAPLATAAVPTHARACLV